MEMESRHPATIIRCAAVSKPLRRRILHPAFLIRASPAASSPATTKEATCTASSRLSSSACTTGREAICGGGACVLGSYTPLSSRRSLIVLRRWCKIVSHQEWRHHHVATLHSGELTVCNPASGERWVLPPHDVFDQSLVLLDVNYQNNDGARAHSSFKLLAAHLPNTSTRWLTVQVFSSDEREWVPLLTCAISRSCHLDGRANPVVLRGAVHWLCLTCSCYRILKWERRGEQPPKASLMKLPPSWESRVHEMCLALSPAADGTASHAAASLSVVVLGLDHIAVWVGATTARRGMSSGSCSWEHRYVIREGSIARPMELRLGDGWLRKITGLEWFCEGSGAL
ncbi:hypothetical protein E2562_020668 [Oryza meyeriana var. granulata]|uniref:DUF7595 domain-containing protein n=1 Tax=Oryza meyeriana var. granulata TaxID=110450 RepID=A0A6G1EBZ8_9ORYZ|nr:hypothetical protein E2562_020668 [Oryza meyeriana var. granulata]